MDKHSIKKYIPSFIWNTSREISIIRSHKKLSKICNSIIDDFENGQIKPINILPKKDLGTKKIIWQYWGQGLEDEHIPDLIKLCFKSVDENKGDYTVIRITDKDYADYINLPNIIDQKKNCWSKAHFSDMLRLALLCAYGGVWLDATIFLSGSIPEQYSQYDFFMFQRNPDEPYKKWWKNSYAYYYGWNKNYKVRVLNSVIYAQKSSRVLTDLFALMLEVWKKYETVPDYFIFMIMFNEYINRFGGNCPIVSDCVPQYLAHVKEDSFPCKSVEEIIKMTSIHKFNNKVYNISEIEDIIKEIQHIKQAKV